MFWHRNGKGEGGGRGQERDERERAENELWNKKSAAKGERSTALPG